MRLQLNHEPLTPEEAEMQAEADRIAREITHAFNTAVEGLLQRAVDEGLTPALARNGELAMVYVGEDVYGSVTFRRGPIGDPKLQIVTTIGAVSEPEGPWMRWL